VFLRDFVTVLLTDSFAFLLTSNTPDCVAVDHCGLTPLQCTYFELALLAIAVTNLILLSPIIANLFLLDYCAFTKLIQSRC
jgi:hypothetical protein